MSEIAEKLKKCLEQRDQNFKEFKCKHRSRMEAAARRIASLKEKQKNRIASLDGNTKFMPGDYCTTQNINQSHIVSKKQGTQAHYVEHQEETPIITDFPDIPYKT